MFIENCHIPSVYSYHRELSPAELSPSLRSHCCMQIFRVSFIGNRIKNDTQYSSPFTSNSFTFYLSESKILFFFNDYKHACVPAKLLQSCLTLRDPMDCSLPGSSVHGIFQVRILQWVAISFSRGAS